MKCLFKFFLAVLLVVVASASWAVYRVSEKEIDGVRVHVTPRVFPGTSFKHRDTAPSKFILQNVKHEVFPGTNFRRRHIVDKSKIPSLFIPLNVKQTISHYFQNRKLDHIEGIWISTRTGEEVAIVNTNVTRPALTSEGHSETGDFDYVGLTVSGAVLGKELWSLEGTSSPAHFRVKTPLGGNSLFILTGRSTISLKGKPYLLKTYPKDNSNLSGSGTSNSQLGEDIGGFFGFSSNISAMAELCPSIAFNQTAVKRAYARWTVRNQDLLSHVVLLAVREGVKDNVPPAEIQEFIVTNSLEIKQGLWAEMKKDKSKWKKICEKFPDNLNSGSMDFNQFLPEIASRLRVEPLGN